MSPATRIPRHIGIIPDGNRRWADERGLPRGDGYTYGVEPGVRLLDLCRELGVEEVSVYGFTKENVRRPSEQVDAFRRACVDFAERITAHGAALLAVGDTDSPTFPDELRPMAAARTPGDVRLNLLVNYGWRWDLQCAMRSGTPAATPPGALAPGLGSAEVSRIELVIRWGGRRRLSGFLPLQCAYADLYVVDTLWPAMRPEEILDALSWYGEQDVTLGG